MRGDEFALIVGKSCQFHPDPTLQFVQGGKVALGILLVTCCIGGISLSKCAGYHSGGHFHVFNTVPPVGILHVLSILVHGQGGNVFADV